MTVSIEQFYHHLELANAFLKSQKKKKEEKKKTTQIECSKDLNYLKKTLQQTLNSRKGKKSKYWQHFQKTELCSLTSIKSYYFKIYIKKD